MDKSSRRDFLSAVGMGLAGLVVGVGPNLAVDSNIVVFVPRPYKMMIRPKLTPAQRALIIQAMQKINYGVGDFPQLVVTGSFESITPVHLK
jgi:hypothetical protein